MEIKLKVNQHEAIVMPCVCGMKKNFHFYCLKNSKKFKLKCDKITHLEQIAFGDRGKNC